MEHRLDNDPVATREINWDDLDKTVFLCYGGVLFTGATAALYPLSTLKTHLQVDSQFANKGTPTANASTNLPPRHRPTFVQALRGVVSNYGFRGLYRGFGTVALGAIPGRGVYLTTLEFVRYNLIALGSDPNSNAAVVAARASFIAGGVASLSTQLVVVPVDVISQRQMVSKTSQSAVSVVRSILQENGIRGLYRGLGPSIASFVPSSAVWWSGYAAYQRLLWGGIMQMKGTDNQAIGHSPAREVTAVQVGSAVLAGLTSSLVTTPLDVVKTRVQVGQKSVGRVVRELVQKDGFRGFYRGIGPRMFNVSIWGTTMVTTYEFLKRLARKSD